MSMDDHEGEQACRELTRIRMLVRTYFRDAVNGAIVFHPLNPRGLTPRKQVLQASVCIVGQAARIPCQREHLWLGLQVACRKRVYDGEKAGRSCSVCSSECDGGISRRPAADANFVCNLQRYISTSAPVETTTYCLTLASQCIACLVAPVLLRQ